MTPAVEAAVRRRIRAVAAHLRGLGIGCEETGEGVRASGRRLRARWLRDARLRDLGRWL